MFIRRKPNKSGSTSVQVVVKTRERRQRVVKSLGVGHSEHELLELERQGRDYIDSLSGPMRPGLSETDNGLEEYLATIQNRQIQIIGPELIFGTLYDRMGYAALDNAMFRHLVICRLYNPGSKLKTVDYLSSCLHVTCSVDKIYRFLDELCLRPARKKSNAPSSDEAVQKDAAGGGGAASAGMKDKVEQITFAHTRQVSGGEIAVCFHDMTTLYLRPPKRMSLGDMAFQRTGRTHAPRFSSVFWFPAGGIPSAMRYLKETRRKAGR